MLQVHITVLSQHPKVTDITNWKAFKTVVGFKRLKCKQQICVIDNFHLCF